MQKEVLEKAIKSVQAALEIKKRADALAAAVKAAALKAEEERQAKLKAEQEAKERAEREQYAKVLEELNSSFGDLKYKVLLKDDTQEVRLYRPCKRTVRVSGHDYFLPFPYMLFRRVIENRHSQWHEGPKHACLYVAFTTPDGVNAYYPPFVGLNGFLVCLDAVRHYDWPVTASMEKMIAVFWATEFHNGLENGYAYAFNRRGDIPFNGRYNNWKNMTMEQVDNEIRKLNHISFKDFTKTQTMY